MSSFKLVLSDIDGTILDGEQNIDPDLVSEIDRLKRMEIPFVLTSARSPEGMTAIAEKMGLTDAPLSCYNGAYLVKFLEGDPDVISSHELPIAEVNDILILLHKNYPRVAINLYSRSDWYVGKIDSWVQEEARITEITPTVVDLNDFIMQNPVHKLLLIGERCIIKKITQRLSLMNFKNITFVLSKENYLEIVSKSASKAQALKELANYYQIDLSQTIACGDNFNDVPMIKEAGLGVAMQNAPAKVKEAADIVTATNNHHGVAEVLRKYIK